MRSSRRRAVTATTFAAALLAAWAHPWTRAAPAAQDEPRAGGAEAARVARAPGVAAADVAAPAKGRICVVASLGADADGHPDCTLVAVDPRDGGVTRLYDRAAGRVRIAPDGRTAAWTDVALQEGFLYTRVLGDPTVEPKQVTRVGSCGVPVWSADGASFLLSEGTYDPEGKRWSHETFRMKADGTGRERLAIPAEDTVLDWSPDGAWVVTASSRNAKIGWQLYLMRPDGTERRQLTEGGNPFYARFSPDGRRLVYTDGPWKLADRCGIWVMDLDGKDRRRVLATGKGNATACWSPDGKRLAVAIDGSGPEERGRLEVVDLDGTRRVLMTLPGQRFESPPDWR